VKRANLPPGCSSLRMEDGTQYKAARPGGHVEVADHHARAINQTGGNGDAGLVSAKGWHYLGTKRGRVCPSCRWVWNVWTTECRRCGVATEPE
jgi:hypothetical protein